jgi:hypothetical protein
MATSARDSTTIRIPRATHDRLKVMASETGQQIADIVACAVKEEERRLFMQRFNEAYARMKEDPQAWEAYRAEQAEWDATVADGLPADDDWSELLAAGPDGVELVDGGPDGTAG